MSKFKYFSLRMLLFLAIGCAIHSCKHEPLEPVSPTDPTDTTGTDTTGTDTTGTDTTIVEPIPCDPDTVYFNRDILPLLISNCAKSGCHDAASRQDGVVLDNYLNVINTGDVRAFRPDNSEIYEKITENDLDDRMPPPPNQPLTPDQINLIEKWINQGALNNDCNESGCDTSNVTLSGTVMPILKNYCQGCHNSSLASGGVRLDNYNSIKVVAQNGKLHGVTAWLPGYKKMPQNPQGATQLPECKIRQIKIWIDAGALNN
ncbi:MAG: c-type cytochrome domain-containing protein [Bacteroidia bacterium]